MGMAVLNLLEVLLVKLRSIVTTRLRVLARTCLGYGFGVIAMTTALAGVAQTSRDASPSADEVARVLGKLASGVEASARIRGPVAGNVGQYAIKLTPDGREVGAYVRKHEFAIDQVPAIWINVIPNLGQVVLRVRDDRFIIDKIPSDWIASDYLRERKPQPPDISFIALNPRRNVTELPGGAGLVADSGFVQSGPSPNLLIRTRFWTDAKAKLAHAFTAGVYGVRDEAEAKVLLQALERLAR